MNNHKVMSVEEIITRVTSIAKANQVKHLYLFGSQANGTATEKSDIDFIVKECSDIEKLMEEVDEIPTLRKIDIFNYDEVCNEFLREDMDKYGRKIY